uniref:C-type lectin domain-containing protein n=1 Tax=Cyprinus carpio TaxID=7962 RepID=A0A8C2HWI6_CYPCA
MISGQRQTHTNHFSIQVITLIYLIKCQNLRIHLTSRLCCSGSDSVKIRSSRAAAVRLVLLCVLLLTAVIVLCVQIHSKNTNYTEEKEQLLNKITNLTEEREHLLITINDYKTEKYQLVIQNNNLTIEKKDLLSKHDVVMKQREQLQQENNDLWKRLHEVGNYELHHSYTNKSWTESRQDCKARGADLITINNSEEQVSEIYCGLVTKMSFGTSAWIGLTDSDVEGTWKWVDGSTLASGFWWSGEPNGHRRENCVMSYASRWYDYPCNDAFKWICEKNVLK